MSNNHGVWRMEGQYTRIIKLLQFHTLREVRFTIRNVPYIAVLSEHYG